MLTRTLLTTVLLACGLTAVEAMGAAAASRPAPDKPKADQGIWTAQEAAKADPDFAFQGEYEGTIAGDAGRKVGVQVIALGDGLFCAVILPGGLPGAGWDGRNKAQCDGQRKDARVALTPAQGERKYMQRKKGQFSATETFPPPGQVDYNGAIENGVLTATSATGDSIEAKKVLRKSPTLEARPPQGAAILLATEPGKKPSLEGWSFGKSVPWEAWEEGCMAIAGIVGNQASIRKPFGGPDWKFHLEFRHIYKPRAMGQGRSNSGIYISGFPEIQVLDSFGLAGLKNECAAFYSAKAPDVNMCLPPLSWQTLDVTFTSAKPAANGRPATPARCTVEHNGVVIHRDFEVKGGGGGLMLQHHTENGLAFRNIWAVPIKPAGAN